MNKPRASRKTKVHTIELDQVRVEYRRIESDSVRKLRVRVGLDGVEVVAPPRKTPAEIEEFLRVNQTWLASQLERIDRFRAIRKPRTVGASEILYRGQPTPLRILTANFDQKYDRFVIEHGQLLIHRGRNGKKPVEKSLELWL
jgi:predicted metal-dependent hydrolase